MLKLSQLLVQLLGRGSKALVIEHLCREVQVIEELERREGHVAAAGSVTNICNVPCMCGKSARLLGKLGAAYLLSIYVRVAKKKSSGTTPVA